MHEEDADHHLDYLERRMIVKEAKMAKRRNNKKETAANKITIKTLSTHFMFKSK